MSTPTLFDGATVQPEHDTARLTTQLEATRKAMDYGGGWWTLAALAAEVQRMTGRNATEASISARLRDLRKPRNGGHQVERRRRGDPEAGLWEYRLGAAGHYPEPADGPPRWVVRGPAVVPARPWRVIDMEEPDGTPLAACWTESDAIRVADALNGST